MNEILDALQVHMNHLKVNAEANDLDGFKAVAEEMYEYLDGAIFRLDVEQIESAR